MSAGREGLRVRDHRERGRWVVSRMRNKTRSLLAMFYEVPWCVPQWGWRELSATIVALSTGSVARGRAIDRFRDAIRGYLGVEFALPVNRGRTAIEVALRAMGVGPGDEVILPSYVCPSVLDAVVRTGATPVFADIDDTLNVTPSTVIVAITPRTRCVIVPHLFGRAAAIDEIEQSLKARGIRLIDDAAQALGARCGGRLVGSFGDVGIVSCGPGKPLSGAAGGMLVTNDAQLFERAAAIPLERERAVHVARRTLQFWMWRRWRRYTLPFRTVLDHLVGPVDEAPHVSARLSNLDAAIALAQLRSLVPNERNRRRNAALLVPRLACYGGVVATDFSPSGMPVKLVCVLPEGGPTAADAVMALARDSIEAQGGYSPLPTSLQHGAKLERTIALWSRVLTVPLATKPWRRGAVEPADLSSSSFERSRRFVNVTASRP